MSEISVEKQIAKNIRGTISILNEYLTDAKNRGVHVDIYVTAHNTASVTGQTTFPQVGVRTIAKTERY